MKGRYCELLQLDGVVYRHQAGRKTFATTIHGLECFVKLHDGIGWREILKNLCQGRLPIIGAQTEYRALTRLAELNIPSLQVVEFGRHGLNPAQQQSYLVTKALIHTQSLEDFCAAWPQQPPSVDFKRRLIRKVAELAASLHNAGINHRDFYLCHLHLDLTALARGEIRLHLIDLHRAQIRRSVPWRWQVKDIAGLYFSAMRLGLTWRDYLWFVHCYTAFPRDQPKQQYRFWQAVERRAYALLVKTYYKTRQTISQKSVVERDQMARGLPDNLWACQQLLRQASVVLKDDATTTVFKTRLADGSTVLVKRYNVRSLGKAFKRWFKPSRASKAWYAGVRFNELGILTPRPLAFYEKRFGWLKTESYLITEYLDGEELGRCFKAFPLAKQQGIVQQLHNFLRALWLLRTSHGDMKASNFMWTEHGVYCLDLDGCRMWSHSQHHQHAWQKDVKRLAKNAYQKYQEI